MMMMMMMMMWYELCNLQQMAVRLKTPTAKRYWNREVRAGYRHPCPQKWI